MCVCVFESMCACVCVFGWKTRDFENSILTRYERTDIFPPASGNSLCCPSPITQLLCGLPPPQYLDHRATSLSPMTLVNVTNLRDSSSSSVSSSSSSSFFAVRQCHKSLYWAWKVDSKWMCKQVTHFYDEAIRKSVNFASFPMRVFNNIPRHRRAVSPFRKTSHISFLAIWPMDR